MELTATYSLVAVSQEEALRSLSSYEDGVLDGSPKRHIKVPNQKSFPGGYQGIVRVHGLYMEGRLPVKKTLFQPEDVTPTQPLVEHGKTESMVRQGDPEHYSPPSSGDELDLGDMGPDTSLPLVVRVNGVNYLIDGHHRMTWHTVYNKPFYAMLYEEK